MNSYLGYYAIGIFSLGIAIIILINKFFCKPPKKNESNINSKQQSKNIEVIKQEKDENLILRKNIEEKNLEEEKAKEKEKIDKDKANLKATKIKKSNQSNTYTNSKYFELEIKGFTSNIVYLAYRYDNQGKITLAISEEHNVKLYKFENGKIIGNKFQKIDEGKIKCLCFDNNYLAIGHSGNIGLEVYSVSQNLNQIQKKEGSKKNSTTQLNLIDQIVMSPVKSQFITTNFFSDCIIKFWEFDEEIGLRIIKDMQTYAFYHLGLSSSVQKPRLALISKRKEIVIYTVNEKPNRKNEYIEKNIILTGFSADLNRGFLTYCGDFFIALTIDNMISIFSLSADSSNLLSKFQINGEVVCFDALKIINKTNYHQFYFGLLIEVQGKIFLYEIDSEKYNVNTILILEEYSSNFKLFCDNGKLKALIKIGNKVIICSLPQKYDYCLPYFINN